MSTIIKFPNMEQKYKCLNCLTENFTLYLTPILQFSLECEGIIKIYKILLYLHFYSSPWYV